AFRQVFDNHFQRPQHGHSARGVFVQVVTQCVFQHGHVHHAVTARYADHVAEVAHRTRGKTTATHTGNGRHTRIVPASDDLFIHQKLQLTRGGNGVIQIQTTKYVLTRTRRYRQVVDKPVIQGLVVFKFQRTYGVRNAFDGVRLAVGKVVGGVNTPFITGLMVMRFTDAVQNGVTQVHVG